MIVIRTLPDRCPAWVVRDRRVARCHAPLVVELEADPYELAVRLLCEDGHGQRNIHEGITCDPEGTELPASRWWGPFAAEPTAEDWAEHMAEEAHEARRESADDEEPDWEGAYWAEMEARMDEARLQRLEARP